MQYQIFGENLPAVTLRMEMGERAVSYTHLACRPHSLCQHAFPDKKRPPAGKFYRSPIHISMHSMQKQGARQTQYGRAFAL